MILFLFFFSLFLSLVRRYNIASDNQELEESGIGRKIDMAFNVYDDMY